MLRTHAWCNVCAPAPRCFECVRRFDVPSSARSLAPTVRQPLRPCFWLSRALFWMLPSAAAAVRRSAVRDRHRRRRRRIRPPPPPLWAYSGARWSGSVSGAAVPDDRRSRHRDSYRKRRHRRRRHNRHRRYRRLNRHRCRRHNRRSRSWPPARLFISRPKSVPPYCFNMIITKYMIMFDWWWWLTDIVRSFLFLFLSSHRTKADHLSFIPVCVNSALFLTWVLHEFFSCKANWKL